VFVHPSVCPATAAAANGWFAAEEGRSIAESSAYQLQAATLSSKCG